MLGKKTYEHDKKMYELLKKICDTDIRKMNPTLLEVYAETYDRAWDIYEETHRKTSTDIFSQKDISLSSINWSELSSLDKRCDDLVNKIVLLSNNKSIYGIAVGFLLEKVEHPLQNICLVSDLPEESGGWGKDGFDLGKIVDKQVEPFLNHMDFEEHRTIGYVNSSKKFCYPGIPYGLDYCNLARITDPVMHDLMRIAYDVEYRNVSPKEYLKSIFTRSIYKQIEKQEELSRFFVDDSRNISPSEALKIIDMHRDPAFYDRTDSLKNISNLPVRAIWTYFKRYCEETPTLLVPDMYHRHNATDTIDSPGDICLRDRRNGRLYECIDVKGCGKKLTWDEVSSALSEKILPSIKAGNLKGGYQYIYTDEPQAGEKADIRRHLSEVNAKYHCSITLTSFDDFFSLNDYNRLSEINCNRWLDRYREEVESNRYKELPYVLRAKLKNIYAEEGIAKYDDKAESIGKRQSEALHSQPRSESKEKPQPICNSFARNLGDEEMEK